MPESTSQGENIHTHTERQPHIAKQREREEKVPLSHSCEKRGRKKDQKDRGHTIIHRKAEATSALTTHF
jgi:hypothetical protein